MDALSEYLAERTKIVEERDNLRYLYKEAVWREAGDAVGGAVGSLLNMGPLVYLGAPAALGTGAAIGIHKATRPSNEDVDEAAQELLKYKENRLSDRLNALVDKFGEDILESPKQGKGVRLG